jgi:hypothetical protein
VTPDQRKKLENYIAQIEEVADRADKLKSHVDAEYRKLLDNEVQGYRDLIKIWRTRLKGK